MDQRPSSKEGRRSVVQGRTPRGNRKDGIQADLHTSSPRHTGIWTSGGQQDIPTGKSKVLVAEYATRCEGLRTRMCRMPMEQSKHATHQSTVVAHISHARSYAIRNCRPRFYH